MNTPFPPQKDEVLFSLFGLAALLLGWFFFVIALLGFFILPAIILGTCLLGTVALFLFIKFLLRTDRMSHCVFLFIAAIALATAHFSPPTVFSGRDQGSISEAAIRLAQNGQLPFRFPASEVFFSVYGPGLALNFPGFAYTGEGDLVTQFPLAYTSWLAAFYALFGLAGLTAANAFLLFLFLATLYQFLRGLAHPYFAISGTLLAAFGFLPLWFVKFTLTENLAVFLFTFLALCLTAFLRNPKFIYYVGGFLAAGLLAFTRIEGYVVFLFTFLFFFMRREGRTLFQTYPWKSLAIPGLFFLLVTLWNFFLNLPYYRAIGRALRKFLGGFGQGMGGSHDVTLWDQYLSVGSALLLYGLLPLFVAGFFGAFILYRAKKWPALVPLFLALPTALYLIAPNITLDHPWMLRRYYFTLFPSLLIAAVIGFAYLSQRKHGLTLTDAPPRRGFVFYLFFLAALGLFASPALARFAFYQENHTLLPQVERFAQEFSPNDLILIDREATGNGYAMATGPLSTLFRRQAVYFFNPEDLDKIDFSRFSRVYLLTPEGNASRYTDKWNERMIFRKTYTFTKEELVGGTGDTATSLSFPENRRIETKNLLFQLY